MKRLLAGLAMTALAFPVVVLAQKGGVTAAGWQTRLDRGSDASGVLSFMSMGTGVHATTGPAGAGVFWRPGDMAKGNYTIGASFRLMEPSNHENGYGLVIGGSDLSGPNQRYTYFLVSQNGRFLIKRHNGTQTTNVADWTMHASINRPDAKGTSTNVLSVEAGASQVRFLVNGTEVSSQPRSAVDADGIAGIRVNHFLNVHIDDLKLGM